MARYKQYDYEQQNLLPISFSRQILTGTFEHTLSHIIDLELNLSAFDARFNNDDTGAPAYEPAILLTRQSTRFPSVTGRYAIKPRSTGHFDVKHHDKQAQKPRSALAGNARCRRDYD